MINQFFGSLCLYGVTLFERCPEEEKSLYELYLSALQLLLIDQPGSPLLLSNMDEASLGHFNELLFSLLCPAYRRFA